jgi:phosphatidylinositol-3-phosphatase
MKSVSRYVYFVLASFLFALNPSRSYGQSSTPPLGHVVVVALENHSSSDVVGSSSMPYYNSLISQYGLAQNFFANVHGSFPDYAMLTSGELITADGSGLPGDFPLSIDNVERELIAAGKTWKVYAEGLPSVGYTGGDSGLYLKRHNPFAYMSDNLNSSSQANNIVPFSQFATDLANNALPNFSFIVPNAADDSEDCPGGGTGCSDATKLATADQWLQTNISPLLTNPAFQQDGLLVLWWDEGNAADGSNGGGQVPVVLVGPMIKQGFRSSTFYRHENVLRTIAEGLGLGFPGASIYVVSMGEFFGPRNTPPGAITGQVTDSSTGAAIAGATVSYSGGSTTTDSSGNYTLSNVVPGTYTVTASATGHASRSSTVSVTSGNTATLNFQLTPTVPGAITGQVTDSATGAAIAGATVSYSGGSTTTDSSGNYTLSNVAPGSYTVTASAAGHTSRSSTVSVTSGNTATLNFQLTPVNNTPGAITGQVTDSSTGAAIVGATVSYSGGSTTTNSTGSYMLSNVAPGTYTVTASATGYTSLSSTVSVTSGNTATVNFQLNPLPVNTPGTIKGRVTNITTGGAVSGATVSFSGGSTTADSSGNYSFSNVTPGTYSVTATHTGYFAVTHSAVLASGATVTLNFAMATGGKIAGTVTNSSGAAIAGAAVSLTGGSISTTVNTTTNSNGGYNSNWMPVGSYTVTVSASGHATQNKTATANTGATTTLNFTLQ